MTMFSLVLPVLFLSLSAGPLSGKGMTDTTRLTWPSPPERARILFESSISSSEDLEDPDEGFFSGLLNIILGGRGSRQWLVQPVGIAVSAGGKLYIADPGAAGVHILDPADRTYAFVGETDGDRLISPVGVACSPEGRVFISDPELGRIVIADGDLETEGTIRDHLIRPTGLAVRGNKLFVADAGKHAILVYSLEGKFLQEFGRRGSGEGEFNFPVGLAVRDSLFVVDALNYRIQEFNAAGDFAGSFGAQGNAAGRFASPKSIALDGEGNLYVTDALMDAVQIFDPSGRLLMVFGRQGNREGEFMSPSGIAIDASDRIYIVDSLNRRIQVFRHLP